MRMFWIPWRLTLCLRLLITGAILVSGLALAQTTWPVLWNSTPITNPYCVAYSPDGTMLAVAGGQGTNYYAGTSIQIFSVATGNLVRSIPSSAATVYSLAFSPNSKNLVDGGNAGENVWGQVVGPVLETWNLSTGQQLLSLPTAAGDSVNSVAFSPDGKTIADGGGSGGGGILELWSNSTGQLIGRLATGAYQGVSSLAFSPDGKTLVDGGIFYGDDGYLHGGVLEAWLVSSRQLIRRFALGEGEGVNAVAISPDGTTLAEGGATLADNGFGEAGVANLWSLSTGALVKSLPTAASFYAVYSIAFSRDGKNLATGGDDPNYDGVLDTWQISSGNLANKFATNVAGSLYSVSFSPDGTTMADTGVGSAPSVPAVLETWSTATNALIATWNPGAASEAELSSAVAFSSDSQTLAATGVVEINGVYNGVVNIFGTSTGQITKTLNTGAGYGAHALSLSPDGRVLAVGGVGPYQDIVELWSPSTGAQLFNLLTAANGYLASMALSPDGKMLADCGETAGGSGILEIWNCASGKLINSLGAATSPKAVAFSPDGKTLAVGEVGYNYITRANYGLIELWSLSSAQRIGVIYSEVGQVDAITYSLDGKTLAIGGSTGFKGFGILEIWDVATGAKDAEPLLYYGTSNVAALAYSTDRQELFVGTDQGLQVFSAINYELLAYFAPIGSTVSSVAISPNGGLVAEGVGNGLANGISNGLLVAYNPYQDPNQIAAVALSPDVVLGGASVTGSVTLNSPAPAGGDFVSLSCDSSVVRFPPFVVVPSGAKSATFSITTSTVPAESIATIVAQSGGVKATESLTITTSLAGISLATSGVIGGNWTSGSVLLTGPAPPGGLTVFLKPSASALQVPATLLVPAGSSSAVFPVTTSPVSSTTLVNVTASLGTATASAPFTVIAPTLFSLSVSPTSVQGSSTTIVTGTVRLSGPAPSAGIVVSLSSDTISAATVPSKVVITAGNTSATFTVKHSKVTSVRQVTITAKSTNSLVDATLDVTP